MAEVILAERTLSGFTASGSSYMCAMSGQLAPFVENEEYTIVWDGTEYVCVASVIDSITVVGNQYFESTDNADTGEPFLFAYVPEEICGTEGGQSAIFTSDTGESHTVAIYQGELEEESPGISIVLYDRTGEPVTYEGVETITTDTPEAEQGATFTYGTAVENAEYELSMASGDQKVTLDKGSLLKEFTMKKPENLLPEHIKKGVDVAGVVGEFAGDEAEKTVDLAMADGNQVIEADEDTVLTKVTVTKPETLLPENIKKDVDIGGIIGTFSAEQEDEVTFFDYDGTEVAKYPLSVMTNLAELPTPPVHEGLIFQGWNWTLEEIQSEIAITESMLNVGAMYITDDGKTRLYINIHHSSQLTVTMYFTQAVSAGFVVDWGDGSSTVTRSGTGTGSFLHTYSALGDYVITLDVADGCTMGLGYNSSTGGVFGKTKGGISNILRKVEIGKNVTIIGAYAFYYCYFLETISLPNTITSFGTYAFRNTTSLKFVTIPKGVTGFGTECFYYCFALKHVSIPIGVTTVNSYLFDYCCSLEEIIFPTENAVSGICVHGQCTAIKALINVANYGSGLYGIEKVVYKASEMIAPIKLAYYCYGAKKISLYENILAIGANAFTSCEHLKSIRIPDEVTSIGDSAFENCKSLKEIILPESLKTIGASAFGGCWSLKSIILPVGITSIGSRAFINCNSLEEIVLPESMTAILDNTFNNCQNLRKLVIPAGVTDIAANWLNYTYSLREVHFLGETPPTFAGELLSYGDLSNCTFYVPKGTLAAYQAAEYLSTYASQIVEAE